MASIRGSSQFRQLKGATVFGITGPVGPTGATGANNPGPTGATSEKYAIDIDITGSYILRTQFYDGDRIAASGKLYGITGNTVILLDGKTGSTGFGYVFAGSSAANKEVTLRGITGSTGFRSFVGVTSDNETITIFVEKYDGEYTLFSGTFTDIIATDNSLNLIGITSAKYGEFTQTLLIRKANVFEKVKSQAGNTGSLTYTAQQFGSFPIETLNINLDPVNSYNNNKDRNSRSKVFSIDLNSFGYQLIQINITDPPVDEPIGFSLHLQNGPGYNPSSVSTETVLFKSVSGKPIQFPLNKQPCVYLQNKSYVIHFVSIKDTWYAYVFGSDSGDESFFCDSEEYFAYSSNQSNVLNDYYGITGACCTPTGCTLTTLYGCTGYFVGAGSTCGTIGTNSICSEQLGSCCVKNIVDGKVNQYCIDDISAIDCLSLRDNSTDTTFGGIGKTCLDLNCSNSFDTIGGCCDGFGNCSELEETQCILSGGNYLGDGVLCYSENKQPTCSTGIGACCKSGICTEETITSCLQSGGRYYGSGISCGDVMCSAASLSCGESIGVPIKPGDVIGGGVVVGIYNPKQSKLLGAAHAFSSTGITSTFMFGGETLAKYYQSEIDYVGYGLTGEQCDVTTGQQLDSYYLIVSLNHAAVNSNGDLINPTEESSSKEQFVWYGSGIGWGPILNLQTYRPDDFTFLNQTYDSLYMRYGEGYYGITGESLDIIIETTFQTCYETRKNGTDPVARLFTRNIKTSNGIWNRNWGLYNTIRMISADNAHYLKLKKSGIYTETDFDCGQNITSIQVCSLFDSTDTTNSVGLTANPSGLSDWYLPSHDELAFIAANVVTDSTNSYNGFDLNSAILQQNGTPIYGWYWSSTGSFDITNKEEGVYINGKPNHGSVAWAIYFDENGSSSNFKVKKEDRQKELKVRPIRAIRCDGVIPNTNKPEYKLWKLPKLLRDNI